MRKAFICPTKYVQGEDELLNLGYFVKTFGKKALLIADPFALSLVKDKLAATAEKYKIEFVSAGDIFKGECSRTVVAKLQEVAKENKCACTIGLGGGKAIDTSKCVAAGNPLIICPTIAATDAPTSHSAVLYTDDHEFDDYAYFRQSPSVVLIDLNVIANAPARFLVSGMGDALATYFEARACWRTGARTMARGNCSHTSLAMAKLCYDLLLEHSAKALEAVDRNEVNQDLENVVEACIYLSGFGAICGGLAAAHAINDGLGAVPQIHANGTSHGEKVAFGLIAQLILEKAPEEEWNTVLDYIHAVGLPSTLADLGVTEFVEADIRRAAKIAASPKEFTKNVRADITADEVYEAILAADKAGAAK
ncbi:MAG TPA: glycerol dehydrogenase [Clostridiales bacterium]|nr:glycerol dehydrogenase [Clostridiales bacterium]